jgi:hypothetical protein
VSYIKFVDKGIPEGLKTHRYAVTSPLGNNLGQVQFYGAWRKFCFFPEPFTSFDTTCLNEIAEFCSDKTAPSQYWREND